MLFGLMVVAFIVAYPIITLLGIVGVTALMNIGDIYRELIS